MAIALTVTEDDAEVHDGAASRRVRFAPPVPAPRTERVRPGHLVAVARLGDEAAILWRWFDAVVLDCSADAVRLWEPAHGLITAQLRDAHSLPAPGRRVHVSAGLPGADWWALAPRSADPRDVDPQSLQTDLDAVRQLYTEHGLWSAVFPT